ncbi:tRNA uridine-5-carboxymethylaminomethyl(34) synthesis GTPase MnmE [Ferruginibacter lapsinanis]|uniref:tRNA uridine-5-carboxymethylaminomethyl(34) synthesis GTPase MnmE n=1 Tax=Ferruginibacter lapsinanis TaxID=563172 RepID=UPI001E31FB99|nr:tRNA uridine-5-carboxymethylaminomethyl(34) synthesis GTPase MnmE [Ferruginibacter lapsinanis]UEG49998.1 tRNA uridine-5-carboxymethylaminomethyl(34) synthesis GTPase MnmE [Ferruginibacter lapsinanis]
MLQELTGWDDTIVAIATPPGVGAIGVIRLSGKDAIGIVNQLFPSKDLLKTASHTIHVGLIKENDTVLDEVVVSIYKNPKSYTGEDVVELGCHGSPFIQQQVLQACIRKGARLAKPGEFTQRAFLNGKLDLTQAEAVADLIASESEAVHQTALQQMKGGFSNDIKLLREQLINFAALIELELDFGEEDVEFADRNKLEILVTEILLSIKKLIQSFKLGNIIKNGVTTVIAGRPNAGKSTLLNAMLNEERAIVTDIAGTTRDTIEEKLIIDGIVFRLVDTAGIREATDVIEKIGIERSIEKINTAGILIYVFDASTSSELEVLEDLKKLQQPSQQVLLVANKIDKCHEHQLGMLQFSINEMSGEAHTIFEVSALNKTQVDDLIDYLPSLVLSEKINTNQTIVVNSRHYNSLISCEQSLLKVQAGLQSNISGDLLAMDIRYALQSLGEITGEILHDRDILGTIFGKFCIGK